MFQTNVDRCGREILWSVTLVHIILKLQSTTKKSLHWAGFAPSCCEPAEDARTDKTERFPKTFCCSNKLRHYSVLLYLFLLSDINECDGNPCHANAQCTNTVGSFLCQCNSGYAGSGFLCTGKFVTYLWCTLVWFYLSCDGCQLLCQIQILHLAKSNW